MRNTFDACTRRRKTRRFLGILTVSVLMIVLASCASRTGSAFNPRDYTLDPSAASGDNVLLFDTADTEMANFGNGRESWVVFSSDTNRKTRLFLVSDGIPAGGVYRIEKSENAYLNYHGTSDWLEEGFIRFEQTPSGYLGKGEVRYSGSVEPISS